MKLMSPSRRVIRESIASKRSPTKARRSHSSIRMSCNKEEEVSHYDGGEGVRSSGMRGCRSCLLTHWPSISFWYPKEVITPHQSEFAETHSNGRTLKEEKVFILHHHRCRPMPPRHIRWPTKSSFFFISQVIDSVFFRWLTSKVLFPILQSCHSRS